MRVDPSPAGELTRAVVLAAGRGTRMRAAAPGIVLEDAQRAAADRGLKGLVPFGGHPFLAWVLAEVADAGFTEACLVVGPGADAIREHFERVRPKRLHISFAVQDTPLGSAHAVLAAERFAAGGSVAVINSDNLYPSGALRALRGLSGSGLTGFHRDALLAGGISADRIAGFAIIECDADNTLVGITEKPDAAELERAGPDALVSMTCWRFGPAIFDAIRATPLSVRGEYELPDAVRLALRSERFEVVPSRDPVLDLSRRDDIPIVSGLLRGRTMSL